MRVPFAGRFTFSGQFVAYGLLVLIVGMLTIGLWVQYEVKRTFIARAADATALFVDSFIAHHIQELETGSLLGPEATGELDDHLLDTSLGRELVVVKLWATDGTISYSTNKDLVGLKVPPSDALLRALDGEVVSDLTDLSGPGHETERQFADLLLETYAPISLIGGDEAVAVAEFYQRPDGLLADIGRAQKRGWLVVASATMVMYLLLVGLARGASKLITSQRAELEGSVERLSDLLERNRSLQARMRGAAGRVTALNEQFLRQISADLHDGPAQNLALAMLRIEALDTVPGPGDVDGNGDEDLTTIASALDSALTDIRSIAKGLRLPEVGSLSLSETALRAIHSYQRTTGTTVDAEIDELPVEAPLSVKITVYRVLQEALANSMKHAPGATQAVVMAADNGDLRLSVSDDGPGFRPNDATRPGALGLAGMEERVRMLGGTFRATSSPKTGARLDICLPLARSTDE